MVEGKGRQTEVTCRILKEENSSNITQFCTISLLSVEGNIKILASGVTEYLLRNSYIDTMVQGGVPGMPGCIEHTGVVTHLICKTRENRGDLSIIWLNLTNAYGSIPHKLVTALASFHVLEGDTITHTQLKQQFQFDICMASLKEEVTKPHSNSSG